MIQLWSHQQRLVDKAKEQRHVAAFMEPGTGKTGAIIRSLCEEYNKQRCIWPTLIFSPLSVCAQWKAEFARFSKIPEDKILVLTGDGPKRVKLMRKMLEKDKHVIVITNYEGVRIKAFYDTLIAWGPAITVLDESHRVKDSESVTAKKIYPLTDNAKRRFIMTGTPVLNSMLDIFGQYRALDATLFGTRFWPFKQKYFFDANAGMPSHVHFPNWKPKPSAMEQITRAMASSSVQAKKSECLDLPPLVKVRVPVELSAQQKRAYIEMEKDFVTELKGTLVKAEFAMTKTLRMQQILAGFVQAPSVEDDPTTRWFDENPRLKALEEILETIGDEKVIIWTTFKPTYKRLGELAEKLGRKHAFLTGEQSLTEKQQAIADFTRGDVSVLISNPAAGGTGVNLAEAPYSVYFMRGYSLEHYLQSEARNYRGGSEQHSKVTHYHLVATDTLDDVIATALETKQDVAEQVLAWAKKHVDTV